MHFGFLHAKNDGRIGDFDVKQRIPCVILLTTVGGFYEEDFFGKHASLTVSGQLHAEAFALAFRDVYTFGPTFRAENSNTTKHASEFWMVEPEIAFADLQDDMDLAEDMIKYVINYVLENCKQELEFCNKFIDNGLIERLTTVANSDFARVTYTDAVKELEKVNDRFVFKAYWGCDLQTEHERYLTEELCKCPVFVTDYPKEIKAFYMRLNDDGKTVAASDLLVPGIGELVGGSQREEDYDKLCRPVFGKKAFESYSEFGSLCVKQNGNRKLKLLPDLFYSVNSHLMLGVNTVRKIKSRNVHTRLTEPCEYLLRLACGSYCTNNFSSSHG